MQRPWRWATVGAARLTLEMPIRIERLTRFTDQCAQTLDWVIVCMEFTQTFRDRNAAIHVRICQTAVLAKALDW